MENNNVPEGLLGTPRLIGSNNSTPIEINEYVPHGLIDGNVVNVTGIPLDNPDGFCYFGVLTTKSIEGLGFKKRLGSRKKYIGEYCFKGTKGSLTLIVGIKLVTLYLKSKQFSDKSGSIFQSFYHQNDLDFIKRLIVSSTMCWSHLTGSTPTCCIGAPQLSQ